MHVGVQTNGDDVLRFVDGSIQAIHLLAAGEGEGQYSHEQRVALQKLVQHRKDLEKKLLSKAPLERSRSEDVTGLKQARSPSEEMPRRQSERRKAPPPPANVEVQQRHSANHAHAPPPPPSVSSNQVQSPSDMTEALPPPPDAATMEQLNHTLTESDRNYADPTPVNGQPASPTSNHTPSQHIPENNLPSPTGKTDASSSPTKTADLQELLKTVDLPEKIGPELLEEVRKSTGLSFDKSKVAVETVLGYVGFKVPALEGLMDRLLGSLHFGRDISDEDITSHDAKRMSVIFSELTACKDDSQQRSWALHEDEAIIKEYLQELLSILENAKPSICRKVVSRDNYEILHSLVQYYQMEMRGGLCLLLLKVFGAVCALEREVVLQLLYSVLPLELGQELQLHHEDVQRVCYIALVMTMIFSTGDNVSLAVSERFNQEFFLHILNLIENPPTEQFEDGAVDLLISFVLAFNLHLTSVDTNVVLRSLAAFGTPKVFTEHIMVLINRGDDPVKSFDFKPQPPNSVLKLFHDLYADLTTADLLYTNDAKVLMDVIVGRMTNLSPGDEVRSSFLALCQKVVQNSSYSEHCHRSRELQTILQAISVEEADTPDDQRIAMDILSKNPDIFSQG
ncbi:hypothetical protein V1264_019909 [Littorina saxatilis]|uniref:SPIN90/Ldb17 leucine-rich domain-containing protein n=1 Tax=Littorina saxatilis TaxID=31220 RepID=A0AAN9B922_9CAEN